MILVRSQVQVSVDFGTYSGGGLWDPRTIQEMPNSGLIGVGFRPSKEQRVQGEG